MRMFLLQCQYNIDSLTKTSERSLKFRVMMHAHLVFCNLSPGRNTRRTQYNEKKCWLEYQEWKMQRKVCQLRSLKKKKRRNERINQLINFSSCRRLQHRSLRRPSVMINNTTRALTYQMIKIKEKKLIHNKSNSHSRK